MQDDGALRRKTRIQDKVTRDDEAERTPLPEDEDHTHRP